MSSYTDEKQSIPPIPSTIEIDVKHRVNAMTRWKYINYGFRWLYRTVGERTTSLDLTVFVLKYESIQCSVISIIELELLVVNPAEAVVTRRLISINQSPVAAIVEVSTAVENTYEAIVNHIAKSITDAYQLVIDKDNEPVTLAEPSPSEDAVTFSYVNNQTT